MTDGAILECRLLGRLNGQVLMNVLHYRYAGSAATVVEGDDVTSELNNTIFNVALGVVPLLISLSSGSWQYEGIEYQWIHHIRYTSSRVNTNIGPGTRAGTALPQNLSSTMTKRSIFANKHGRGSIHLGGLVTTDVINGLLTAARLNDQTPLAAKLIQHVDLAAVPQATALYPIILNKLNKGDSKTLETILMQNTVRTQRRRTVGLGI